MFLEASQRMPVTPFPSFRGFGRYLAHKAVDPDGKAHVLLLWRWGGLGAN